MFGVTRDRIRYGEQLVEKQFIEFLREEVQAQVGPDGDVDRDIRELEELLHA